jgi:hypothetical protein
MRAWKTEKNLAGYHLYHRHAAHDTLYRLGIALQLLAEEIDYSVTEIDCQLQSKSEVLCGEPEMEE